MGSKSSKEIFENEKEYQVELLINSYINGGNKIEGQFVSKRKSQIQYVFEKKSSNKEIKILFNTMTNDISIILSNGTKIIQVRKCMYETLKIFSENRLIFTHKNLHICKINKTEAFVNGHFKNMYF